MTYRYNVEQVLDALATPPLPSEKNEHLISHVIAELDDRCATLRTDGHSTNSLRNMIERLGHLFATLRRQRRERERQRQEEERNP